mgnify:CR=1 FL=1
MSSRELCIMACVFCRDWAFQDWAGEQARAKRMMFTGDVDMLTSDDRLAKFFILAEAGVSSRNELDTDPEAAQRFHDLVRKPFLEWKEAQYGVRT